MAENRPDKKNIFQAENVVVHKTQPQGGDVPSIGRVHEERDVPIGSLLRAAGYLVVFTVLICIGCWGMFEFFATQAEHRDPELSPLAEDIQTPPPLLQSNPPLDMARWRKQEDSALKHSGAGPDGAPRMSIEQAMQAIAERGLPQFTASDTASDTTQAAGRADTTGGRATTRGTPGTAGR